MHSCSTDRYLDAWQVIQTLSLNFHEATGGDYPLTAAQEPDNQEKWHRRLAGCFQVLGTDGERLLPAKSKVSFPLSCGFYAHPVYVGNGSTGARRLKTGRMLGG